ncbi:MAG: RNA-binding protein [Flavobacteriaceae bacterium]|nr:RNA-binding protein [Flavobacteriaceae bacterium]
MTILYVSNLNYKVTERDLRCIFSKYGAVINAKLIIDFKLDKSKGIAFVKMKERVEAHKAVAKLHMTQLDGRTLKVEIAREREISEMPQKRSRVVTVASTTEEGPKKEVIKTRKRDKQGLKNLFDYLGSK